MSMKKICAGDTVYLLLVGNMALSYKGKPIEDRIVETTVAKVGRKYIEVESRWTVDKNPKFDISEEYRQVSNYCADYELYFDKQDIFDKEEKKDIMSELTSTFRWTSSKELTLDQLRRIRDIVNEGE